MHELSKFDTQIKQKRNCPSIQSPKGCEQQNQVGKNTQLWSAPGQDRSYQIRALDMWGILNQGGGRYRIRVSYT